MALGYSPHPLAAFAALYFSDCRKNPKFRLSWGWNGGALFRDTTVRRLFCLPPASPARRLSLERVFGCRMRPDTPPVGADLLHNLLAVTSRSSPFAKKRDLVGPGALVIRQRVRLFCFAILPPSGA